MKLTKFCLDPAAASLQFFADRRGMPPHNFPWSCPTRGAEWGVFGQESKRHLPIYGL